MSRMPSEHRRKRRGRLHDILLGVALAAPDDQWAPIRAILKDGDEVKRLLQELQAARFSKSGLSVLEGLVDSLPADRLAATESLAISLVQDYATERLSRLASELQYAVSISDMELATDILNRLGGTPDATEETPVHQP